MINVIYVCYGNICRSVSGEYILKYLIKNKHLENNINVISRGISSCETDHDIYYPSKQVLKNHNIPFSRHYAKKINMDDIKKADYILCMEQYHLDYIKNNFKYSNLNDKLYLLNYFLNKNKDIIDPYYYNNYEECFNQIYQASVEFLNYLIDKYNLA